MQTKKQDFMIELEPYDAQTSHPRIFELYEEYRQKNIAEIIKTCRKNFEKADLKVKRELATEVESEVGSFRVWLEEIKGLQPSIAHYYSTSLKSLLLGLPVGVQVAYLFDMILNAQTIW